MEFNPKGYEDCIECIAAFRMKGKEWDVIKNINIDSYAEMMDFPSDYSNKWNDLVDWAKKLEEDTQIATGYIYDENINNNIKIPPSPKSAWQIFKKNKLLDFGIETATSSEISAKKILDRLKLESYDETPRKRISNGICSIRKNYEYRICYYNGSRYWI